MRENKKVIVTGGCGFIGAEVVQQLADYDVLIVDSLIHGSSSILPRDNRTTKLLKADIRTLKAKDLAGYEGAAWVHLAALPFIPDSFHDPVAVFDTNLNGTLRVIRAAVETQATRLVLVSTCEVYKSGNKESLSEDAALDPLSPYANSKLAAEVVLRHQPLDLLPFVVLRLFNAYGPRYTQSYFVPEMIRQCRSETAIRVGTLETRRDFTYVADAARAVVSALDSTDAIGQTINVGTGRAHSMAEILELIRTGTNAKHKPIVIDEARLRPQGRDPHCFIANPDKAAQILNWRPRVSLKDGLRFTIEEINRRDACSGRKTY